jgi:hypothetical protein
VDAAAEVHQPLRTVDEGCEQVRRDDVDRRDARAAQDAGVVDHRVYTAQPVDLIGHRPRLGQVRHVADDGRRASGDQSLDGGQPFGAARVDVTS